MPGTLKNNTAVTNDLRLAWDEARKLIREQQAREIAAQNLARFAQVTENREDKIVALNYSARQYRSISDYKQTIEAWNAVAELDPERLPKREIKSLYLKLKHLLTEKYSNNESKDAAKISKLICNLQSLPGMDIDSHECHENITLAGRLFWGVGDFQEARNFLMEALKIEKLESTKQDIFQSEISLKEMNFEENPSQDFVKAQKTFDRGDYVAALKLFQDLEKKLNKPIKKPNQNRSKQVKKWVIASKVMSYIQKCKYYLNGENLLLIPRYFLEKNVELGNAGGIFSYLLGVGDVAVENQDYLEAVSLYDQAARKLEAYSGYGASSILRRELGDLFLLLEKSSLAEIEFKKALQLHSNFLDLRRPYFGRDIDKLRAILGKTIALSRQKKNNEARGLLTANKKLIKKFSNIKKIQLDYNIAQALICRFSRNPPVIEYYDKALEIAQANKFVNKEVEIHIQKGQYFLSLRDYQNAKVSYDTAGKILQKKPEKALLRQLYSNYAHLYTSLNNIKEANIFWIKAYEVESLYTEPNIESSCKVANIYINKGEYNKASEILDVVEKASNFSNFYYKAMFHLVKADLLIHQQSYDEALENLEKSYVFSKKEDGEKLMALVLLKMGEIFKRRYDFSSAASLYNEAHRIKGGHSLDGEPSELELKKAFLDVAISNFEKAKDVLERALPFIKDDFDPRAFAVYYGLGTIYSYLDLNGSDLRMEYFSKALKIAKRENDFNSIVEASTSLGNECHRQGDSNKAIRLLKGCISLIKEKKDFVQDEWRQEFVSQTNFPFVSLMRVYLANEDFDNAIKVFEESREISYEVEFSSGSQINSVSDIQGVIDKDTAILIYVGFSSKISDQILITRNKVYHHKPLEGALFRKFYNEYGDQLVAYDDKHIRFPDRDFRSYFNISRFVDFYRNKITFNGGLNRDDPAQVEGQRKVYKEMARKFYSRFIEPHEEALEGKTKLIILADGTQNLLPFETFIDKDGKYLVERFQVYHLPSLAAAKELKQRARLDFEKNMLAFGGAIYNPEHYQEEVIDGSKLDMSFEDRTELQEDRIKGVFRDRQQKDIQSHSGNNIPWSYLVKHYEEDFDADVFLGKNVSKKKIKSLGDKLRKYRVINFSVHGYNTPKQPKESGLELSIKDQKPEILKYEEIANLPLEGNHVSLAACSTNLGKALEGTSNLALTDAFIKAGAASVCTSLWNVVDESASVFFQAVYKLMFEEGKNFPEAMTEVKRMFIAKKFNDKRYEAFTDFHDPLHWAPYVYVGL